MDNDSEPFKRLFNAIMARFKPPDEQTAVQLYQAYKSAGCPFGGSIEGFHIWVEYGQHTTRN